MRKLIAQLLADITGVGRYHPDFEWSSKLWTHNVFRAYEWLFGRREGIRIESETALEIIDGRRVLTRRFYTLEAILGYVEGRLRGAIPKLVRVPIEVPQLAFAGGMPHGAPRRPAYLWAIAFDAVTGQTFDNTSESFSHTVTGANPIFWAGYGWETTQLITASSYGGVANTLARDQVQGNTRCALYYQANPATGANTFATTTSGTPNGQIAAQSYSGAKATGIPDAVGGTSQTTGTTLTGTLNVVAANSWIVFAFGNIRPTSVSSGGVFRSASSQSGSGDSDGPVAAGSRSIVLSVPNQNIQTIAVASFAPQVASFAPRVMAF